MVGAAVLIADALGRSVTRPARHLAAVALGLGLDIARRSAEEAGGHLTMGRSTLGGTRVALHLPRFATGR